MNCSGCGHPRSRHFKDMDGVIRCLDTTFWATATDRGRKTWVEVQVKPTGCECADGVLPTQPEESSTREAPVPRRQEGRSGKVLPMRTRR